MTEKPFARVNLFESGIYSASQVHQLTGVPIIRIRRWMRGYTFPTAMGESRQRPVWEPGIPQIGSSLNLSFNDMLEIRSVDEFRQKGVTLTKIRAAIIELRTTLGVKYPFSTSRIFTDGKDLFSSLKGDEGRSVYVELLKKQQTVSIEAILDSIKHGYVFEKETVSKWFPNQDKFPRIVIDPRRAFGSPTIEGRRLEVEVIAAAFKSSSNIEYVASWFGIEAESVQEAVSFHKRRIRS